ncbi:MAG: DUF4199 domain-containing protein [Thermomonas sp.]
MGRDILKYGVIAGLVVAAGMWGAVLAFRGSMTHDMRAMAVTYLVMLVALSTVFLGIKHHRDVDRGGVIRFWPAFGLGLGISFVAGVFYMLSWETVQATVLQDFATDYAASVIAQAKANGADAATLAKTIAQMESFKVQYANPLFRLPMTFVEVFPVGVLVSLVSALVLRNPWVLPAR